MSMTSMGSESGSEGESVTSSDDSKEYKAVVDTTDAEIQTKPIHPSKLKEVVEVKFTDHQIVQLLTKALAPKEEPKELQDVEDSCISYERKYEITLDMLKTLQNKYNVLCEEHAIARLKIPLKLPEK